MTATLEQLRTAYETCGMSFDEILQDNPDFTPEALKVALLTCSSKFRKDVGEDIKNGNDKGLDFTDEDLSRVNEVILDLALGAEDEHLRAKMACYVRDDKKGRREVAALLRNAGNQFNIYQFNDTMKQIRGVAQKLIKDSGVIDVQST